MAKFPKFDHETANLETLVDALRSHLRYSTFISSQMYQSDQAMIH